jgi:hypothetical protein
VRGEVESMASVEDEHGTIDTWVGIRITETLKGPPERVRAAVDYRINSGGF